MNLSANFILENYYCKRYKNMIISKVDNIEETIKRLKTYLLSNQISFHTLKSLECIKYIKTIEAGGEEDE